jgi:hypothetical protein
MNADCQSIDSIITALYECISGPAGAPRDWQRHQGLFHPTGRSMRTGQDESGKSNVTVMDCAQYRANTEPVLASLDFFEIETAREEQRFGNVASVRSVYEARAHPDDAELIKQGENFVHLYNDGSRWWIMNIIW